jgi:hypothetical protein
MFDYSINPWSFLWEHGRDIIDRVLILGTGKILALYPTLQAYVPWRPHLFLDINALQLSTD